MPVISFSAKITLAVLIGMLLLSLALLAVEVATADDLKPAQKAGWLLALLIGTFFTAVIYFAQGRTGRLGRLASVLIALGILLALGIVAVLALRL
ncbi:MAG: hypothetical protein C4318_03480 [Acidimicrobiia bacterium]